MKTLKFAGNLVPLVLSGEKTSTWRLFDDKDLKVGDDIILVNRATGESFAQGKILTLQEKTFREIGEEGLYGHEKYKSFEEMISSFRSYYGDSVNKDSLVKIINFKIN